MVMDRETSAQDKCAALLEEVLLNNITPYKEYVGRVWLCCLPARLDDTPGMCLHPWALSIARKANAHDPVRVETSNYLLASCHCSLSLHNPIT